MIGIIGAMEEEVAILKDKIVNLEIINVAHVVFVNALYKKQHEQH
jgi:adenosylhomocysteine nucleosidase